jgi:hypothetical protein
MGTNMVDRAILPRYKCKLRKIQRLKKEVYNDFYLKSLSLCGTVIAVQSWQQNESRSRAFSNIWFPTATPFNAGNCSTLGNQSIHPVA